ncbi:tellurite resistance TerB family protein [Halomonas sabkhae]|uniref:tellurite resistance TerB family protein n=1 Tax=Halomonas sabkhae TaxID=626223 RepID=UPI0025B4005A|nr:tellurite resistance TerB family protein [Halomonas sabkhae]MDN3523671.1 tellurite resistance TerB family protein [Halomonas sabkhae]
MNAQFILKQLMKQAGSGSSSRSSGGNDLKGMVDSLSSQLSGSGSGSGKSGGQSGGFDPKQLLGGGALGMLVGSKRGRKMGGKALKYGAIAGVGMLAWKAWQNSRGGAGGDEAREGKPVEQLEANQQEERSLELLQAMIMAARADGHIDEQERAMLAEQIDELGADDELHQWVEQQLQAPLDAAALAQQADSPQAAREMYLVSVAIIDDQNAMERAWLDQLATALELDDALKQELEQQAVAS